MIALDTNILVYARRKETPHHEKAYRLLMDLAEGDDPWCIPWPCVYEFLRVVTHPRIFTPPTRIEVALEQLGYLFDSTSLHLLGASTNHRYHLAETLLDGRATGNLVHDGHIAALLREHGVREIWTTDRDFSRFPGLSVRNPFADPSLSEPRQRAWTSSRRRRPDVRQIRRQRAGGASKSGA